MVRNVGTQEWLDLKSMCSVWLPNSHPIVHAHVSLAHSGKRNQPNWCSWNCCWKEGFAPPGARHLVTMKILNSSEMMVLRFLAMMLLPN